MRRSAIAVAVIVGLAGVALAGEAPEHGEAGGGALLPLVFSTINLLIFLWILARFAMPGVRAWVRERRARIVNELQEAVAARAAAEGLRAEWEPRLPALDQAVA